MTTTAFGSVRWTLVDGWTVVRRNLTQLRHAPGLLLIMLMAPVGFLLGFGYLFGGAITVAGGTYREYLVPGILGMVAATGVVATAATMAGDTDRGVVDRFRSMPTARVAVPFGQAGADIIVSAIALAATAGCGFAVGWRLHRGLYPALAALGLLILFRYAMTWVGVFVGLAVRDEKVIQQLAPLIFGSTMYSNAFVPTAGMPTVLRAIADWNPVSAVVAATRELFGNPVATGGHLAWPMQHPVAATIGWSALLLVIFVPLSAHRYHRIGR
jgi:ABC-2 type transport system permease protein